jgi:hypothetical protein
MLLSYFNFILDLDLLLLLNFDLIVGCYSNFQFLIILLENNGSFNTTTPQPRLTPRGRQLKKIRSADSGLEVQVVTSCDMSQRDTQTDRHTINRNK